MADSKNLFISVKGVKIPMPEPVIEAVTQAEYDALTPEQIANGLYFVSDDIAPATPGT